MINLINNRFETNREAFEHCELITKNASHAFHTAFSHLPRYRAWSIYAVYAFCRTADDLVDEHDDLAGLDQLQRELTAFINGAPPTTLMWQALTVVFETYDMDSQPFFDMLHGQRQDAIFTQPQTQADLEDYCYYVAGSVGLMILPILSTKHQQLREFAIHLGVAMQLTNILRDVGEDYQNRRLYLPADVMREYQLQRTDLQATQPSNDFINLWEHEAQIADHQYKLGLQMMPDIDAVAQPALLAATYLYRELLTVAREQHYPVLQERTYLSDARKAQVLQQVKLNLQALNSSS
ncbi:phytoene/squalene synthase family protein [Lactiplantibacillus herbarum]|uniref:phytoene/squalene synthase family protein n=1 Tax=Lactiplantibacillus herbarum TaxID=1670446 RepID=UPI00064E8B8F|nr:phytoene/squalene synthase family protein [Lactiplantibacillus herbarum]